GSVVWPVNKWWVVLGSYLRPTGYKSRRCALDQGERSAATVPGRTMGWEPGLRRTLQGSSSRTGNAVGCNSTCLSGLARHCDDAYGRSEPPSAACMAMDRGN